MASLPVYLSNIKSSGVYTFEFDKSSIVTTTTGTLRLLIGFSKTGPFNTPVFCQDTRFFTEVFGQRDKQLEKQGSFFHLSALEMLGASPIIALNLLALNDELDKTDFISFSTSSVENNQSIGSAPLSKFYNTNKFWKLETEKVLSNIQNQEGFAPSLINFANVGKSNVSILVTKGNIQGLDITAKDWYGEADVPEFMDSSDLINDYTIRVNLIKGDITDFKKLSVDPILGAYFDNNGIKKVYKDANGNTFDGLVALLQNPNIVSLGEYIGSIIPNFADRQGNNLYIQDLVNLDTPFTGVYSAVDEDLFDGSALLSGSVIDLLGGSIDGSSISELNFLSYLGSTVESLVYGIQAYDVNSKIVDTTTEVSLTLTDEPSYIAFGGTAFADDRLDTITIEKTSSAFASEGEWSSFVNSLRKDVSYVQCISFLPNGSLATGATAVDFALVKDVLITANDAKIQIYPISANGVVALSLDNLNTLEILPSLSVVNNDSASSYKFTSQSQPGLDYNRGILSSGDTVLDENLVAEPFDLTITNTDTFTGFKFSHTFNVFTLTIDGDILTTELSIKSGAGDINTDFTVTKINDYEFTVNVTNNVPVGAIQPNDFIIRGFEQGSTFTKIDERTGNTRFTRIREVTQIENGTKLLVKTFDPYFLNNGTTVTRYKSVDNFVTNYNAFLLRGFSIRQEQLPNGTTQRQTEILNVLRNTSLYDTLADKNAISFRYIVDSFDGSVEPNTKNILSSLCKDRKYAFAILNSPSVKTLTNSTNPLFKFNNRSDYDARYIATGGNQGSNPTNTFSLPTLNQGSNYSGFFHPNLILREGPTVKLVPPAAYVSNNFIEKYKVGTPYDIIAGPRRGVIGGTNIVGVEYIYDRKALDVLEPFGLNVIVPTQGIGNVINSNQTAQQNIKSALSSIHVRELLIYIQETVEQILANYRWEFNTPQTRLEIKTLVDGFLNRILSEGGLSDFETVMNTINNTPDVIDNDMGIIDIAVEPVRGLSKLVQRYTILKTGGIAAGDFQII